MNLPVSLGEQRQTLADQAVAQQQDILGSHAAINKQTQDQSPQYGAHTVTHFETG